jgi:type IV pilus assembly protein PilP
MAGRAIGQRTRRASGGFTPPARRPARQWGFVLGLLAIAAAQGACGDDTERATSRGLGFGSSPSGAAASSDKPSAPDSSAAGASQDVSMRALRDSDFVESEFNRDPFRNVSVELKSRAPITAQRTVVMPNTALSQMRIIAIITGIDQPRAMILDEKGVGHVTRRGDFVGRAEIVQTGGAENLPVALNWRIERIRENEVILAREDPSAPGRPPLTRVLPLHPVEEDTSSSLTIADNGEG